MAKWKVYTLDVWGNSRDGYEVNDRSGAGNVSFPDNANDKEILDALVGEGILTAKKSDYKHVEIDGDDMFISLDYKGKPVLQLEKI